MNIVTRDKPDVDFYIVTRKGGGNYELAEELNHRPTLMRFIREWQYDDIERVYCGNLAMNSFQDITGDVAYELWNERESDRTLPAYSIDFIQAHVPESLHVRAA